MTKNNSHRIRSIRRRFFRPNLERLEGRHLLAGVLGKLDFLDNADQVATYYRSGDNVYLRVADSDVNDDPALAETLQVRVTSQTENTGVPFTASVPMPGVSNVGNGSLTILEVGYTAVTENWTLTATSANPPTLRSRPASLTAGIGDPDFPNRFDHVSLSSDIEMT